MTVRTGTVVGVDAAASAEDIVGTVVAATIVLPLALQGLEYTTKLEYSKEEYPIVDSIVEAVDPLKFVPWLAKNLGGSSIDYGEPLVKVATYIVETIGVSDVINSIFDKVKDYVDFFAPPFLEGESIGSIDNPVEFIREKIEAATKAFDELIERGALVEFDDLGKDVREFLDNIANTPFEGVREALGNLVDNPFESVREAIGDFAANPFEKISTFSINVANNSFEGVRGTLETIANNSSEKGESEFFVGRFGNTPDVFTFTWNNASSELPYV